MKILVVDDNPSITELLTDFISLLGFEADTAQNGIEAVIKLKKKTYDSVITDGYMPYMDGFDLCRFIKSHFPMTYIVGITDSMNLNKFRESGADDCFSKPVDCCTLLNSVVKHTTEQQGALQKMVESKVVSQ
jgi:DNA-binding response OmpR family regulator